MPSGCLRAFQYQTETKFKRGILPEPALSQPLGILGIYSVRQRAHSDHFLRKSDIYLLFFSL